MASGFFLLPNERGDGSRRGPRPLVATLLGLVGGLLVAAGTRLPLATLPGLGGVNFLDYQATRAAVCLGIGAAVAILCLGRLFRFALLCSGIIVGLLVTTGLDLQRTLRELTVSATAETADLAGKVLKGTRLEVGATLLVVGCLLCILAGFIGIRPRGWRG